MSKTVLVGCKLPSGIVLEGPTGPVHINGMNTSMIPGGFGITHVPADVWAFIQAMYNPEDKAKKHAAFANFAIFTPGTDRVADVLALGDDLTGELTGLEGIDPNNPGAKLQPSDESAEKLKEAINENATKPGSKAGTLKGADRAAALEAATAKG